MVLRYSKEMLISSFQIMKHIHQNERKRKKSTLEDDKGLMMVSDIITQYNESCSASTSNAEASQEPKCDAQIVLLHAELENAREELKEMKLKEHYQREMYSVMPLRDEVICMETGLPN